MELSGKIVLVTGAQQGIGRAVALRCAGAGADVAVNWLDDEAAAKRVADEVRAAGRRALAVRADLGRLGEIEAMVAAVEEGLGPIEIGRASCRERGETRIGTTVATQTSQ